MFGTQVGVRISVITTGGMSILGFKPRTFKPYTHAGVQVSVVVRFTMRMYPFNCVLRHALWATALKWSGYFKILYFIYNLFIFYRLV